MSKYNFSEQNAAPVQLSAGGCVRMGIRETAKQIKTHVVASWPFALLFALSWALVFRISVHIVSGGGISVLLGVAAVFLSLLSVSCAWQVGATKVLCLQQMPPRRIVWRPICRRELLLTLFLALFALLPIGVLVGSHLLFSGKSATLLNVPFIATLAIVSLILLLYVPLFVIAMGYLLDTSHSFFHHFWDNYVKGLRHYGLIFSTLLLMSIIIGLFLMLLLLPCVVLTLAHLQSMQGLILGDKVIFPAFLPVLEVVLMTGIFFVALYVATSIIHIGKKLHDTFKHRISISQ